jgi:hypothetical protein
MGRPNWRDTALVTDLKSLIPLDLQQRLLLDGMDSALDMMCLMLDQPEGLLRIVQLAQERHEGGTRSGTRRRGG